MADTQLLTVAHGSTMNRDALWGPYWISTTTGAFIYMTSDDDVNAKRTSDGGSTWDTSDEVEAGTAYVIGVFFDQQVVGDSGNLIHVVWMDSGLTALRYANYNISTGSWSTPVSIATGSSSWSISLNEKHCAITKTKSGDLIALGCINATADQYYAYRSTDDGASWSSIASPWETDYFDNVLGIFYDSADPNDALFLFWDASTDEITSKTYDQSANSWSESGAVGSTTFADTGSTRQWDATTRLSDGHVIFAAWSLLDNASAVLRTYDVDTTTGPTFTGKTSVVTSVDDCAGVGIFVDQVTDDIYISYMGNESGAETWQATLTCYYKKSTDGMVNWSSQTTLQEDAADDERLIHAGAMGTGGGRFMPVWYNDDLTALYINLNTDIVINPVTSGSGALTVPWMSFSGSGTQKISGSGSLTVPWISVLGNGIQRLSGSGALNTPFLALSGAGEQTIVGTSELTLPWMVVEGVGAVGGFIGSGNLTTPWMSVSGSGAQKYIGTSELTLPWITLAGSGLQHPRGSGDLTLPFLSVSGSGLQKYIGTMSLITPFLVFSGQGAQKYSGSGALTLPWLDLEGSGLQRFSGSAALTIPFLLVEGSGAQALTGIGILTLPFLVLTASGSITVQQVAIEAIVRIRESVWVLELPQYINRMNLPEYSGVLEVPTYSDMLKILFPSHLRSI